MTEVALPIKIVYNLADTPLGELLCRADAKKLRVMATLQSVLFRKRDTSLRNENAKF